MKKIFYIILVIVILLAIGYFVKQQAPQQPEAQIDVETVAVSEVIEAPESEENTPPVVAVEELNDGEVVGIAPIADVEDVANETVSEAAPENEAIEEVEEVNPDETAGEDETIIAE